MGRKIEDDGRMNEREDEDGDIREQVMTTTGSSHAYIHTPQLSYTWLKIQAQLGIHAYMMMKMNFINRKTTKNVLWFKFGRICLFVLSGDPKNADLHS